MKKVTPLNIKFKKIQAFSLAEMVVAVAVAMIVFLVATSSFTLFVNYAVWLFDYS